VEPLCREEGFREREIDLLKMISEDKITAITGMRGSGKSSLLMMLLQRLLKRGERAAYVNLEDIRMRGSKTALDDVVKWFGYSDTSSWMR
jgi:predicted AAA+ superfamily ATPase